MKTLNKLRRYVLALLLLIAAGTTQALSAHDFQRAHDEYVTLLTPYYQRGLLDNDGAEFRRVHRIGGRIRDIVIARRPEAYHWPWEIHVINTNETNALSLAGGKLAVTSGLIRRLSLTDAELAAVIAHELAHTALDHSVAWGQRMEQAGVLGALIGRAAGQNNAQVAQAGVLMAYALPYARGQEEEADRFGMVLLAEAGYHPQAMISLLQKMRRLHGATPEMLSTHPAIDKRIAAAQRYLPSALRHY